MAKYRVTEEERDLILELLDRNFSVKDITKITGVGEETIYALRKGFKSWREYREDLAKRRGFKSWREYREYLVKRKGFKSWTEYLEYRAKRRGFKSYAEYQQHTKVPISLIVRILYEQGEATLEEVTKNIRKILGVKVKEATVERKIKEFNFKEPWFTITDDQNKRIKINREHFFVKAMLHDLLEEK